MRFSEIKIIKEGYKEVKQKFISDNSEESEQDIHEYIEKFRDLVNRNQLQGNEKNIDYWGKQGFESFKEMVDFKSQQKSKTQAKRSKVKGESITLAENEKWLIVVPLDKDASCFHGKNTDWCTAKPNHNYFNQYFNDSKITLIYFIRKTDLNKWAIAVDEDGTNAEYFDKNDKRIPQYKFEDLTGLDSDKFIKMALDKVTPERDKIEDLKMKVRELISNINEGQRSIKIESILTKLKDKYLLDYYLETAGKHEDYPHEIQEMAIDLLPSDIVYFENPSKEIQMKAVDKSAITLRYIDNPHREVQLMALSKNGRLIEYINNPDKELQLAAVQNDAYALVHIIEQTMKGKVDKDVIMAALIRNGGIIRQLPEDILTRDMYLTALKSKPSIYVEYIPEKYKDEKDFMLAAVDDAYMYTASNLKDMKPELIDEDILETALETSNKQNLNSVIPIILNKKDDMTFDPNPLLKKRWDRLNKEDA